MANAELGRDLDDYLAGRRMVKPVKARPKQVRVGHGATIVSLDPEPDFFRALHGRIRDFFRKP